MLTNFSTVHKRLQRLKELEAMGRTGQFEGRTGNPRSGPQKDQIRAPGLGRVRDMNRVAGPGVRGEHRRGAHRGGAGPRAWACP